MVTGEKDVTLQDIQNFYKSSDVNVTSSFCGSSLSFRLGGGDADHVANRMTALLNTCQLNVAVVTRQGTNSNATVLRVSFTDAVSDALREGGNSRLNGSPSKWLRGVVFDRLQQGRYL